jgi:hypothetical protein
MNSSICAPGLADLEVIDRVARAAHLWVRHGRTQRAGDSFDRDATARHNLAAGIISGICDALDLDRRIAVFSAYAYALLDNETEHALEVAYPLFHDQIDTANRAAFQAGRDAADGLIDLLRSPGPDGFNAPGYPPGYSSGVGH